MTLPVRVALLVTFGHLIQAPCAWAVGEDEWQVGVAGQFVSLAAARRVPGGGLGVEVLRGLTDAWAVRGAVELSLHPGDAGIADQAGTAHRTAVTTGLTYALDVLRVVPLVDASVLFLDVRGGAGIAARRSLGVAVGLGLDYWLDRRWAAGLAGRWERALVRISGDDLDSPSALTVGLRVARLL